LLRRTLTRENRGGREGPNVVTEATLTHACPKKAVRLCGGLATLKQFAQYFFPNRITVQNCSFFEIIGDILRIRSPRPQGQTVLAAGHFFQILQNGSLSEFDCTVANIGLNFALPMDDS
jgi:hypothetical protein